MVWYNRGKAFAKMSPVLCGNGKVCKEYAKTAGVRDGKSGGGVRTPRPCGFTQILHNIYFAVVV